MVEAAEERGVVIVSLPCPWRIEWWSRMLEHGMRPNREYAQIHSMKSSFRFPLIVAPACFLSLIFATVTIAQAPGALQDTADHSPVRHVYPHPRNLKALPRDLSGQEVRNIMEQWTQALGVRCDSCHAEATETTIADDDSRLNYADDSKPLKAVTRAMYRMTEEINANYIANIGNSGVPVTCGTCHRGHIGPEPYDGPPAIAPRQLPLTSSSISPSQ